MKTEIKSRLNHDKVGNLILSIIEPKLIELLNQNIGKKIFKVDGSMTAKFRASFNDMIEEVKSKVNNYDSSIKDSYSIHRVGPILRTSNFIELNLSVCYSEGNNTSCNYTDFSYMVARTDNEDKITEVLTDNEKIKTVLAYDEDRILTINEEVAALLKRCNELQSELPYYAKFSIPYISKIDYK